MLNARTNCGRRGIALAGLLAAVTSPVLAQYPRGAVVQSLPQADDPAELLAGALRTLAMEPNNVTALMAAGRNALILGDPNAAVGFFGRASELAPRDGRVKAGLGSALVQLEKPQDALRLFGEASALGVPDADITEDRGLAYDLTGDGRHAQADYAAALAARPDDDTARRRLALSQGIAGEKAAAIATLDPLIRKRDIAGWRAQTFVLAMNGDTAGASTITHIMMPQQADMLQPFLVRLAALSPADKARAVHFGEMPQSGKPYTPTQLASTGAPATYAARAAPAPARPIATTIQAAARPPVPAPVRPAAPQPAPVAAPARVVATAPSQIPARAGPPAPEAERPAAAVSRPQPAPAPLPRPAAPAQVALATAPAPLAATAFATAAPSMPAFTGTATTVSTPTPAPVSVVAGVASSAAMPATATGAPPPIKTIPTNAAPAAVTVLSAAPAPMPATAPLPASVPSTETGRFDLPHEAAPKTTPAPRSSVRAVTRVEPKPEAPTAAPPRKSAIEASAQPAENPAKIPTRPHRDLPKDDDDATTVPAKTKHGRGSDDDATADIKSKPDRSAHRRVPSDARESGRKTKRSVTSDDDGDGGKATGRSGARKERGAPERVFVQVAGGANRDDMAKAWDGVKRKAPDLMKGHTPSTTPLKATNRLLVGPFKSDEEAQAFVNKMAGKGLSGFTFKSAKGEKIDKVDAAK